MASCRQCKIVDVFLDCELDSSSSEEFRDHLGQCLVCETHVHDVMQLELLEIRTQGAPAAALAGLAQTIGHC